jgi:PIN domain nuclease of toxin-antitoxin system
MLNLDTHILLFALDGSLTPSERKLLSSQPWGISAIVLWEVAKLAQLGRIAVDVASADFTRVFARVHVWPLDLAVCKQSTELDFSSDPADELIAATSVVHRVPLVTRDGKIRKSKMVPIALTHSPAATRNPSR